jgi:hypothetical protein
MNVLLVLVAFWLPGLAFGAAVRLRGWTLAGAAPVLTFGLVSLGGYLLGKLGIKWNLLSFAGWAATLSVTALAISLVLARRSAAKRAESTQEPTETERLTAKQHVMVAVGAALGLAVGATTFLRGISSLDYLNQDWDAPFHGNAVRWIAEHGSIIPGSLGTIANQPNNPTYFYPDTYHALLATLLDKAGLDMPVLLNSGALAVVLAWPLGIAALGIAWRLPPFAVAAAAAVSTWFSTFPYDSLWRGPLWPYVAGVAMLPPVLAIARYLLKPKGWTGPIAIGVAIAGLAGLHTSVVFVLLGLFVLLLLAMLFRLEEVNWRAAAPTMLGGAVAAGILAIPLVLPSLANAAGVTTATWPNEATAAAAFTQMITFSGVADFPQWWIGLPALAGILIMVRRRIMPWFVAGYAVFGGLYAVTVSLDSPLINAMTGPFYNDAWRLAALLPLFGAIAFGVFASTGGQWLAERYRNRLPSSWSATTAGLAGGLAVLLVAALLSGAYISRNSMRLSLQYHDGPGVNHLERAAYGWLAQHVQRDEPVMNDMFDGSVWMYALAGVRPVEWTFYGNLDGGSKQTYLTRNLNKLDTDPTVCRYLTDLGIRYVVVGSGFVRTDYSQGTGFAGLAWTKGFNEVYRNAGSVVYEIEGLRKCGPRPSPPRASPVTQTLGS